MANSHVTMRRVVFITFSLLVRAEEIVPERHRGTLQSATRGLQTAIGVPRVCSGAMPTSTGAAVSAPPTNTTPSPFAMALTLALLLGSQVLATDVYLPALPMLQRDLSAAMPAVQLTMSAFVLAF